MQKDESLQMLYEIRTNLSVISKIKDNCDSISSEISQPKVFIPIDFQKTNEYDDIMNQINALIRDIDSELDKKTRLIYGNEAFQEKKTPRFRKKTSRMFSNFFDKFKDIWASIIEHIGDFKDDHFKSFIGIVIAIVFWLIVSVGDLVVYFTHSESYANEIRGLVFSLVSLSIVLAPFIISFVSIVISLILIPFVSLISYLKAIYLKTKQEKRFKKNERKNASKICSIEENIKNKRKQLQQLDGELSKLRQNIYNKNYIEKAKFSAEREKTLQKLKKELEDNRIAANRIYDSIVSKFKNILALSDWENIDLLIYYISTGRADSLREALQLIDQKKQSEAFLLEIKKASENISSTIRTYGETIGGEADKIKFSIDGINSIFKSSTNGIVDQLKANQAVMDKINYTCAQLLEDADVIRKFS